MENNDVKERLPDNADAKREALKKGYKDYAVFNAEYAEMCLEADNETLASCEEKLSESE